MNITSEEFAELTANFLATQDADKEDEWFATDWDLAAHVMTCLKHFLFSEQEAREARRAKYLELKAEFEP